MKERIPRSKEHIGPPLTTAIFIDGPYLSKAASLIGLRDRNMDFDFKKFMDYLLGPNTLISARYYTGLSFSSSAPPFFNKIKEFGYEVFESSGVTKTEKNAPIDQQLITDLCLFKDSYDIACVVSGDGDFAYPIERLVRDFGKKINIIAARHNLSLNLMELGAKYPQEVRILLLDEHYPGFVMRRVPPKR